MSVAQTEPPDRLALVSSLYGPGTVTSWYLTVLSVVLSWLLHPRKRTSDSIDADLITVLTLPAIAAGHLLYQLRQYLIKDAQVTYSSDDKVDQMFAAMEAPLVIVNASLVVNTWLIVIAALTRSYHKSLGVSSILFLCLFAEIYIFFSVPKSSRLESPISMGSSPKVGFSPGVQDTIIGGAGVLVIGFFFSMAFLIGSVLLSYRQQRRRNDNLWQRLKGYSTSEFWALMLTSAAFVMMLSSCLHIRRVDSTIAQIWVPVSAYSITDLDQAVATAAGATVLGCSLYSMTIARYQAWQALST